MKARAWAAHRYELLPRKDARASWPQAEACPQRSIGARQGALLRIDFGDSGAGYADCHPWPELGDEPLDAQLTRLASGRLTPLLARSLALAAEDARARARGASLFEGLRVPPSHLLAPSVASLSEPLLSFAAEFGVRVLKLKVGSRPEDPAAEARALAPGLELLRARGFRLRLDFNERLSPEAAARFFEALPPGSVADTIDLVEDPCPYDAAAWQRLGSRFGLRLAVDRAGEQAAAAPLPPGVRALVLKPAIQDPAAIAELARERDVGLLVTSYLDHPVGQLGAALCAARLAGLARIAGCGLLTHLAYEETPFARALGCSEGLLIPPKGAGIGFDAELERIPWEASRALALS